MKIIETDMSNIHEYGVCGYKSLKRPGYPEKLAWLEGRFREGLKIKTLWSEESGTQGMIEYLPGESAWRPVAAAGYLFIHCLFVGFRKEYKNKGYASRLIETCLEEAAENRKAGVSVIVRRSSFMAGEGIFLKNGFEKAEDASPDFSLLVKRFDPKTPLPRFKIESGESAKKHGRGLVILRAFQCPYTVKNVEEIRETAEREFGLKPKVIDLQSAAEAQASPNPFGIFTILYNGAIIAHHPISNGRFRNIMKSPLV